MALLKTKTFPELAGIELGYWRLISLQVNNITRNATLVLGGWMNQAAYQTQENKIPTKEVRLELGPTDYDCVFDECLPGVESFSLEIANWIVTQPNWQGAEIV